MVPRASRSEPANLRLLAYVRSRVMQTPTLQVRHSPSRYTTARLSAGASEAPRSRIRNTPYGRPRQKDDGCTIVVHDDNVLIRMPRRIRPHPDSFSSPTSFTVYASMFTFCPIDKQERPNTPTAAAGHLRTADCSRVLATPSGLQRARICGLFAVGNCLMNSLQMG